MTVQFAVQNDQPETPTGALLVRARRTGLPVYLGEPPATPPDSPYLCIYPDGGWAYPQRYSRRRSRTRSYAFQVVYAAKTVAGVEDACEAGRNAFTDWRPDSHESTSPVTEEASGPMLWDGPSGDRRCSITVYYHYTTRRPQ